MEIKLRQHYKYIRGWLRKSEAGKAVEEIVREMLNGG